MAKYQRPQAPQSTVLGSTGSIFDPKDKATGERVPTFGQCSQCGSTESVVETSSNESIRRCKDCGLEISGIRKQHFPAYD